MNYFFSKLPINNENFDRGILDFVKPFFCTNNYIKNFRINLFYNSIVYFPAALDLGKGFDNIERHVGKLFNDTINSFLLYFFTTWTEIN